MKKIKITFTITLSNISFYARNFESLRNSNFIMNISNGETLDINCYKIVKNCQDAISNEDFVNSLVGLKTYNKLFEFIEEKDKWYKSPIIPLLLAALSTGLTLWITLDSVNMSVWDKFARIVAPVIISTSTYIVYRHFKEEPIL